MPQLIPLAAGLIIGGEAITAGAIASALSVAATGLGMVMSDVASSSSASSDSSGTLLSKCTSSYVVPVVYGECILGGNRCYTSTSGDDNKYLHLVYDFCQGEIESFEDIFLDGTSKSEFGDAVYCETYNGSANQDVCSTLQGLDANWTLKKKNRAYIYLRLEYDTDLFNGLPNVTAKIKGRKTFDPRTGVTGYTTNPVLCIYDYSTNTRFGAGIAATWFDLASVTDAANWCDTKSYAFNCLITSRAKNMDQISSMLRSCRMARPFNGEKYRFLPIDYDSSVLSIAEPDVLADSFSVAAASIQDMPNQARVWYWNADNSFLWDSFIIPDTDAISADGETREKDYYLVGVSSYDQAYKIGTYYFERDRLNLPFVLAVHPKALGIEQGDIVSISHSRPGWSSQLCRVIDAKVQADKFIVLTVLQEFETLYDDEFTSSSATSYGTNLPGINEPPSQVTGVTFTAVEYINKNVSYTKLKVDFTTPDSSLFDHLQVFLQAGSTGWVHYTDAASSFYVDPVDDQTMYLFRLLSVSVTGATTPYDNATEYSYFVVGANTPPDDVTNFYSLPQSDTVVLQWDAVDNVDLLGYEVRSGTAWESGLFLAFVSNADNLQLQGVSPGDHSYMIKSEDTRGVYSTNYAITSCTVYGPASYAEKMSQPCDFDESGVVLDNCERIVDATYGACLRIIHNLLRNGGFESGAFYDLISDTFADSVMDSRIWGAATAANGTAIETSKCIITSPTTTDGAIIYRSRAYDKTGNITTICKQTLATGFTAFLHLHEHSNAPVISSSTSTFRVGVRQSASTGRVYALYTNSSGTTKLYTSGSWATLSGDGTGQYAYAGVYNISYTTIFEVSSDKTQWRITVSEGATQRFQTAWVNFSDVYSSSSTWWALVGDPHNNAWATTLEVTKFEIQESAWLNSADSTIDATSQYEGAYCCKVLGDKTGPDQAVAVDITRKYTLAARVLMGAYTSGEFNVVVKALDSSSATLQTWEFPYAALTTDPDTSAAGYDLLTKTFGPNDSANVPDYIFPTNTTQLKISCGWDASSVGTAYIDKVMVYQSDLKGIFTSPVYDRGSICTRRSWPNFDIFFQGTGATWEDQFSAEALWTDVLTSEEVTWNAIYGQYITGNVTMRLGVSSDGVNFTWYSQFESYVIEAEGRYVKYEATVTDVETDGYLYGLPITYKEAYWS
jgi:hypothetical protein